MDNNKITYTLTTGVHEAIGRRDAMEDTHVTFDDVKSMAEFAHLTHYSKIAYLGVFDGHGGKRTADNVAGLLHKKIFETQEFKVKDIDGALIKGFSEADAFCVTEANANGYMNGCTAVVALILDGVLHIANLGDSEAILVSAVDTVDNLTVPHKASVPSEKQRVEALGGHVFFNRVFGTLAVSRAFGDSKYKQPKTSQNFVSCLPAIKTIELTQNHQYLVLACDGLWDVLNHEEAATIVRKQHAESKTPQEIANFLVAEALRKRTEDNVTVAITKINWHIDGAPEKSVPQTPETAVQTPETAVQPQTPETAVQPIQPPPETALQPQTPETAVQPIQPQTPETADNYPNETSNNIVGQDLS